MTNNIKNNAKNTYCSSLKLMTHTPEIGAESRRRKIGAYFRRRFFVVRINRRQKSTCTTRKLTTNNKITTLYKKWKQWHRPVTGRRSGHVYTRNRHEKEQATDRRQNLVPDRYDTQSRTRSRRRFSAPTFCAEIWTVCHQLKFGTVSTQTMHYTKADDTQSSFRRRNSAPKIGADFLDCVSYRPAPVGADRRRSVAYSFC